ncbi:lipopolysaccharide assembly protein LapA domain-containing protein [Neptuniibacter sp. QD48_11]|uniref:lipopolysaccharide assembly protein LapA domain-containing protein n=1 Tax=unclassified Neptuniibacter TaxID=2630693 RepID=UPI0039F4FED0
MRLVKKLIFVALAFLALFIGLMLVINNTDQVAINLVFLQLPEFSLGTWLVATFVAGALIGGALSTMIIVMLKTRLGSARRKIASTQKELDQLRVSSLKDAV